MRGLDVDDGLDRGIIDGKVFRISRSELEAVHGMRAAAKIDRTLRQVHTDHALRLQVSLHKGRASSPAAAHFENHTPFQVDGSCDVVVKLNPISIRLVRRGEREKRPVHRGITIVQECPTGSAGPSGERTINETPQLLPQSGKIA
jgi:hypothetical protein